MAWIIGGPGSGKTTQSLKVARQYGMMYIDPFAMAKKEVESQGSDLKTTEMLKRGMQVPVPLQHIFPLIETKLQNARNKGIVIDGYPRSLEDSVVLERGLGPPDIVIALEVDEEASNRRTLEGQHLIYRPPLSEYLVASKGLIQKYEAITLKVDKCWEPHQVFEVIQFNIDSLLKLYQKRDNMQSGFQNRRVV